MLLAIEVVFSGAGAMSAIGASSAASVRTNVVLEGFVQYKGMVIMCFLPSWFSLIKLV